MNTIIALYKDVVLQVATHNTTGAGFYLQKYKLLVTNDHIVRGNHRVKIEGQKVEKQMATVVYVDPLYDLAFLRPEKEITLPNVALSQSFELTEGDSVMAMGHPYGLNNSTTKGIVSNLQEGTSINDVFYIQHDAALNPGNSGGPLIDKNGEIVGINTKGIKNSDNLGFSLPVTHIQKSLDEFQNIKGTEAVRCHACANLVSNDEEQNGYCHHCGTKIELPSQTDEYEPTGLALTIETILKRTGHLVVLARRGSDNWEIKQGSAQIDIAYHEKSGLITGDAYLCTLPQEKIAPLYEYLLRQNDKMEGLSFSVKGQDVILSLLIFDRYFKVETGLQLFKHLFAKADYYDNVLVEKYGALWKHENGEK